MMAGLLNSGRGMAFGVGLLSGGNFRNALARGGQNMMAYDEQQRRAAIQKEKMGLLRGQDARAAEKHGALLSQWKNASEATKAQAEASERLRSAAILNGGQITPEMYAQNAGPGFSIETMQGLAPKPQDYNKMTVMGPDGKPMVNPLYMEAQGQLAKLRRPQITVPITVPPTPGANKYNDAFATKQAAADQDAISAGESAPQIIQDAQAVRKLLQSPELLTGAGADWLAKADAFAAQTPFGNNERVANTQELAARLGKATLNAIKTSGLGSGQGFTDKDREFLQRAMSGDIQMTRDALDRLAKLQIKAARAAHAKAMKVHKKLKANPELAGMLANELPPLPDELDLQSPQGTTSPADVPLDDLLNLYYK